MDESISHSHTFGMVNYLQLLIGQLESPGQQEAHPPFL